MNLASGQRRMRRDIDRSDRQNRHVGDEPFHATFRKQADSVARLDSGVEQGRGGGDNLGSILFPAYVVVKPVPLESQRGPRSQAFRLLSQHVGKIAVFHKSPREAQGWPSLGLVS